MDIVQRVTFGKMAVKKFPSFRPGDTVGVYVKVKEGEKERLQLFKGVVIKVQGAGMGKSFTVRKVSSGVGVERTFPYASPSVERVEVISSGKVRRGKLYFLRGLKGRAARLQSELYVQEGETVGAADDLPVAEEATVPAAPAEPVEAKKKN